MSVLSSALIVIAAVAIMHGALRSRALSLASAVVVFLIILSLSTYYLIDSFTGSGIDQSVLYFLQTGLEDAPLSEFLAYLAPTVALLAVALAIAGFAYWSALRTTTPQARKLRAAGGATALALALYLNPAVPEIAALAKRMTALDRADTVLLDAPENFVAVDRIALNGPPRDFIVLYLESFERTFLDQDLFPGLTPNLSELQREALNFTDISQVPGTTYTIAGQVASQCGFPLTANGSGSDLFLPGANCVGDLLADRGYALSYMDGAVSSFAGTGTFYRTHQFTTVEGLDQLKDELPDPDYQSFWGLYDDSLLEIAKQRAVSLKASGAPFGLFVQTTDTHNADGTHIPASCDDLPYLDGSNDYLDSIHCGDRLAGDFIRFVRSNPDLKDVLLIVTSDHMARPNNVSDTLEKGDRRNLLMVFGSEIAPGDNDKPGNTLDTGPTLLSLLGAETPALAYGRNLLSPEPTLRTDDATAPDIIDTDYRFLTSMWSYPQIDRGIRVAQDSGRLYLGNRYAELPAIFYLDDGLKVTGVSFQTEGEIPIITYFDTMPFDRPILYVDFCSRTSIFAKGIEDSKTRYCALVGRMGSTKLANLLLEDGAVIGYETLQPHLQDRPASPELYDRKIEDWRRGIDFVDADVLSFTPPNGLVGDVSIRASVFPEVYSWVIDHDTGTRLELYRGLTLLGFNAGEPPRKIAHKDTCAYGHEVTDPDVGVTSNFAADIEANKDTYGAMAIVSHSSVVCWGTDPGLEVLFAGTGLQDWRSLAFYQSYVALFAGNGSVEEIVGEAEVSLGVDARDFIEPHRPANDLP